MTAVRRVAAEIHRRILDLPPAAARRARILQGCRINARLRAVTLRRKRARADLTCCVGGEPVDPCAAMSWQAQRVSWAVSEWKRSLVDQLLGLPVTVPRIGNTKIAETAAISVEHGASA